MVKRVGLLAGWGRFPLIVAEHLQQLGCEVYCVGIKGHADPQLQEICAGYTSLGIGKLGGAIRFFQRHRCYDATMAGKFFKVLLFQKFMILKHLPDWRGVLTFYPLIVRPRKDRTDDTLLTAIVDAFADGGIHFAPATDLVPELLVKYGTVGGRSLNQQQQQDVEFGWKLAKEMGRLDIGQSVVVKGRAILAVEAVEGTDECIRRAGKLCPAGGFTVVKVAKPQQDMRFDVPTIGVGTLQTLVESGGRVLAVEAEKTIILDQEEVARYARKHGLTVVATHPEQGEKWAEAA